MSKYGTILLAEDDENDAVLFCMALSMANVGNPVVHVPNGEDAFSYLTGAGIYGDRVKYPFPCLLVTDLKMPKLSGFDLLERARAFLESKQVPAIVVSASMAESDKERARQLGAQAFFVKAPDLRGLMGIVTELKHSWLDSVEQPI